LKLIIRDSDLLAEVLDVAGHLRLRQRVHGHVVHLGCPQRSLLYHIQQHSRRELQDFSGEGLQDLSVLGREVGEAFLVDAEWRAGYCCSAGESEGWLGSSHFLMID
jgi:hypothetical protein